MSSLHNDIPECTSTDKPIGQTLSPFLFSPPFSFWVEGKRLRLETTNRAHGIVQLQEELKRPLKQHSSPWLHEQSQRLCVGALNSPAVRSYIVGYSTLGLLRSRIDLYVVWHYGIMVN